MIFVCSESDVVGVNEEGVEGGGVSMLFDKKRFWLGWVVEVC